MSGRPLAEQLVSYPSSRGSERCSSETTSLSSYCSQTYEAPNEQDDAQRKTSLLNRPIRINQRRLWEEIHSTAEFGAIPDSYGIARLALTEDDKLVRDYFCLQARTIGCQVKIDEMGNIFASFPGQDTKVAPIGLGSHLDTQPTGGRFDGILGVLSALEVLRALKENNVVTYAPVAAICWTNEEGARFTPGCSGSAVWARHVPLSEVHELRSNCSERKSLKDELRRIGYHGETEASYIKNPLSAHLELHIEQNRRLQDANKRIGIVTNIQGISWYRVRIFGCRAHGGSTPMADRADALIPAAKLAVFLQEQAQKTSATATVGVVNIDRPSSNTVPGLVSLTIDMRHPSEDVLESLEKSVTAFLDECVADNKSLSYTLERIWHSPAGQFHPLAVDCIRKAAENVVGRDGVTDLMSFAGHDSALTSIRVPTSMIFVPSKDGLSHVTEEFTSEEECGLGAQVLLEAALAFDARLEAEAMEGVDGSHTLGDTEAYE